MYLSAQEPSSALSTYAAFSVCSYYSIRAAAITIGRVLPSLYVHTTAFGQRPFPWVVTLMPVSKCLTNTLHVLQVRELEDLMADPVRLRALPRAEQQERTSALQQQCAPLILTIFFTTSLEHYYLATESKCTLPVYHSLRVALSAEFL